MILNFLRPIPCASYQCTSARQIKSGYLALAGFSAGNSSALRTELLALAARGDAEEQETDQFGTRYRLEGVLSGPTGVELPVATIWLRKADGRDHFVTLMPWRRGDDAT